MIAHFESIHIDLWDVVENGDYIPYDDQLNEIPRSQWMEQQNLIFLLNSKAWNMMLCAFSKRRLHKGTQLQECQTNTRHLSYNIRGHLIGKEEQTQSPHP